MPSDWGLELGGQRGGRAQEGEGQGPPEGPELRLPCGSAWAGGKGRGREGRGSCRWLNWKIIIGMFLNSGADKLKKKKKMSIGVILKSRGPGGAIQH